MRLLSHVLLASLVVGCAKRTPDNPYEGWNVPIAEAPDAGAAIHRGRVILVTSDGVCPEPDQAKEAWTVGPLLISPEPELDEDGNPIEPVEEPERELEPEYDEEGNLIEPEPVEPPRLKIQDRFCLYEAADSAMPPFAVMGTEPNAAMVAVAPGVVGAYDRIALTPLVREAIGLPSPALQARASAMGGAISGQLMPPEAGAGELVILHSGPDADGRSAGLRLGAMATHVACPSGEENCAIRVRDVDVRGADGSGTLAGLAGAIGHEVEAWLARVDGELEEEDAVEGEEPEVVEPLPDNGEAEAEVDDEIEEVVVPPPPVLVIATSWHTIFGGGHPKARALLEEGTKWTDDKGGKHVYSWRAVEPDYFEPDVRAVFDALAWARCAGLTVVAGDGVATAGPTGTQGPLLPAGWNALTPDLLPTCDYFGLDALPPAAAPLAWSVGGISADGGPLAVSREMSRSPMLGYGDHVMAPGDDVALTGSGSAALMVGATTALVWSQAPELQSHEVVTRVYASGRPLGDVVGPTRASLVWWLPDAEVPAASGLPALSVPHAARKAEPSTVWVRACDVLARLVGGRVSCASLGARELPAVSGDELPSTLRGVYPAEGPTAYPACGDDALRTVIMPEEPATSFPCPDRQRYSTELSQPHSLGVCEGCRMDAMSGVVTAIHPELRDVESVAVRVWDGETSTVYALPRRAAKNGELRWEVPPEELPTQARAASLLITREGRAVSLPLLFRSR